MVVTNDYHLQWLQLSFWFFERCCCHSLTRGMPNTSSASEKGWVIVSSKCNWTAIEWRWTKKNISYIQILIRLTGSCSSVTSTSPKPTTSGQRPLPANTLLRGWFLILNPFCLLPAFCYSCHPMSTFPGLWFIQHFCIWPTNTANETPHQRSRSQSLEHKNIPLKICKILYIIYLYFIAYSDSLLWFQINLSS